MKLAFILGAALALCSCKRTAPTVKPFTVTGQVFIATKSGEAVKMALVPILVVDRSEAIRRANEGIELLDAKKAESDAWQRYKRNGGFSKMGLSEIREVGDLMRVTGALGDLPVPKATVKTDADGKFSVSCTGNDLLVAVAERTVGRDPEFYAWAFPAKAGEPITFSNDGMIMDAGAFLKWLAMGAQK